MTNQEAGTKKMLSKEILVGHVERGSRLAQVVVKMKDDVGAVASINALTASLKVDIRQSMTFSLPSQPFAIHNAFVSMNASDATLEQLVERLRTSPFAIEVTAFEGREGVVVDTLSFPVNWQGRRVVILAQWVLASMLDGIRNLLGTGGDVILYGLGNDYGREFAAYFIKILGRDYFRSNYDYMLSVLAATGWGIPALLRSKEEFPNMTIRLSSCLECDGRRAKEPVCSFVRGFLSGVFGTITEHKVHCEETQCSAKGDHYCQFELHGGTVVLAR
jgi:predicted hydrocarbon binding protein